MRVFSTCLMAFCFSTAGITAEAASRASTSSPELKSMSALVQEAHTRIDSPSWAALETPESLGVRDADDLEAPGTGRVLNSVRAIARLPRLAKPLAHMYRAVLFEGTVARATKMAMGMRVAQITGSPYTAAHLQRLLRATDGGHELLTKLQQSRSASSTDGESAQSLALDYPEWLTRISPGVTDEQFS